MHNITYSNVFSSWDEALPLGNGHFGGMGYLDRQDGFVFALNHYDVYYKILPQHTHRAQNDGFVWENVKIEDSLEQIKSRANDAHVDPNHPAHGDYVALLQPKLAESYGPLREGIGMPVAGVLYFGIQATEIEGGQYSTSLKIEEAKIEIAAQSQSQMQNRRLNICSIISPKEDLFIASVSQTPGTGIRTLKIALPQIRTLNFMPLRSGAVNDNIYFIENSFYSSYEDKEKYPSCKYICAIKLVGVSAKVKNKTETAIELELDNNASDFKLLATVISSEETNHLLEYAVERLNKSAHNLVSLEQEHRQYWDTFFGKSRICIPDRILETLWYLHLYSLACCSGQGARIYQEACGLHGLWDIKGCTQWGSCWYWDVNIEQAFWPIFTSNHPELFKDFERALLSYVAEAKNRARNYYKMEGIAADFPFPFYIGIWPWCAQYFWWYYLYTKDENFLRETAFPLFRDILLFFEKYAQYDTDTGKLLLFPDIAPEQGPMTRNATVHLVCLKFLLQAAIESSCILKESVDDREKWTKMLDNFPEYPTRTSARHGLCLSDSEWAEDDLFLAHGGILMPIYPVREFTKRSPDNTKAMLCNTLNYVDSMMTHGTHNIWPAPAAAVLGMGDEALRLLYDRGISVQMRANGMLAETTERWHQSCLTASAPVYNPPLMEAGSAIVATINEMLLQSHGGVIEVFPAIPCGVIINKVSNPREIQPPAQQKCQSQNWRDCYFENLLAENAFEVSAWLKDGKVTKVRIKSLKGGTVRILRSFHETQVKVGDQKICVQLDKVQGIISFETIAGQVYEMTSGYSENYEFTSQSQVAPGPLMHIAPTRRRVFLGKDEHTEFYRAIDGFTLDYYPGHLPQSKLTVYKFDFSINGIKKNYFDVLAKQWHLCGKSGSGFHLITADSCYTSVNGRGWHDVSWLTYVDRGGPDELRRDFVVSAKPAEFEVDLLKGQYQILLVTGDSADMTHTFVEVPNGTSWNSGLLQAGDYATPVLMLNHPRDGKATIRFHSVANYCWNLCIMMINVVV